MAKTKAQKAEILKGAEAQLKDSKFLVFADFSQTPESAVKTFRRLATAAKSKYSVVKKRLLRVLLKKSGIDFNPVKYESQVGTVFAKGDISDIAPVMYKFSKANQNFKMLGAFDLMKKEELSFQTLQAIGQLPSREVLLGQVLGGLIGPLKKLMFVMSKIGEAKKA